MRATSKKNSCQNPYFYLVLENIYPATDALNSVPFTASIILGRNIFKEGGEFLKFNPGKFLTKYNNVSGKRLINH